MKELINMVHKYLKNNGIIVSKKNLFATVLNNDEI